MSLIALKKRLETLEDKTKPHVIETWVDLVIWYHDGCPEGYDLSAFDDFVKKW